MDRRQVISGNESWSIRAGAGQTKFENIGSLIHANMNVTTDQQIPLSMVATLGFRVTGVTASNARDVNGNSASLTTAAGGIYTAAAKGGSAIVAATQVYSTETGNMIALDLTLAAGFVATIWAPSTPLFLSLTTPQGANLFADFDVYGQVF